jgi:hypothetical protein
MEESLISEEVTRRVEAEIQRRFQQQTTSAAWEAKWKNQIEAERASRESEMLREVEEEKEKFLLEIRAQELAAQAEKEKVQEESASALAELEKQRQEEVEAAQKVEEERLKELQRLQEERQKARLEEDKKKKEAEERKKAMLNIGNQRAKLSFSLKGATPF